MSNDRLRIGILGGGFVGRAVARGFIEHAEVRVYDVLPDRATHTLAKVAECDFIFVCVPTPARADGSCDTSIVEAAVGELIGTIVSPEKHIYQAIVIRSTVPVGFTSRLAELATVRASCVGILHSPEFLTERCSLVDFQTPSRMIVGVPRLRESEAGAVPPTNIIRGHALQRLYERRFPGVPCLVMDSSESEMVKLACNAFFGVKVAYFNAIGLWAERLGLDTEQVRDGILSDGRIAHAHTSAPGPDGKPGYGGTCLTAGHYVLTPLGTKAIEQVKTGDRVWDGSGFTPVTGTAVRTVGEVVSITARGRTLTGTLDHIHMVHDGREGGLQEKPLGDVNAGEWCHANQVIGNEMSLVAGDPPNGHVKNWQFSVEQSFELGYVVGLWLADGYFGDKTKVEWSMGDKKQPCADRLVAILESYGMRVNVGRKVSAAATFGPSDCIRVTTNSAWLKHLISGVLGCGYYSGGKRAPRVGDDMARGVVAGWLDGDGSVDGGTIGGHSKSAELIVGMDALLRQLGICCTVGRDGHSLNVSTRNEAALVCSWTARHEIDADRYGREVAYASPTMRQLASGWSVQVAKVEHRPGSVDVYSIETESGLYEANGLLTHNCLPKDTADAWHGLREAGLHEAADLLGAGWRFNQRIREPYDDRLPKFDLPVSDGAAFEK